jgi:hypothetical protein
MQLDNRIRATVTLAGLALVAIGITSAAAPARQSGDVEMSEISGDRGVPRRHFRLRDPAGLTPGEAERVYRIALNALAAGYAESGDPSARSYPDWRRYNSAPYLSATHGNHYVNNYANETARAYGSGRRLPVGSIVAKDSFSVTESGGILLGPLFLMEKMPEGFNHVSGDWKYSMIQPDGTLFGETHGVGSQRVQYCIGCHLAVEGRDHLYFVPAEYRAKNTD